ncbi:hypothetical protein BUALT_Bualt07G0105300 [Buddleja alternifolia]|uniref:Uncharacterized protein n=1 Tax=Buddleja alternifolia TaxID=168488 RepID=A0AAV6X9V4_9LAMI|nr:hypothetical protein BUALT_Bualt07G0105300 [Buddleja alternifolia]
MIATAGLHLNANQFEDPLKFNPWRWKEIQPSVVAKCFMPFGSGMKQCAGAEYSRVLLATFLHVLVTKYRWAIVKGGKIVRALVHQLWTTYSNMLFLNRARKIDQNGVEFNQIDAEWHWDNFLILQAVMASLSYLSFPSLANIPLWDIKGILCCLILHIGISEPLYYWIHRLLHTPILFRRYHWLHHSSQVINPFTAGHATFLEHLLLCVVVGIPTLGTALMGYGSIGLMYSYLLVFDFLRCLGHSNVEVIPSNVFEAVPFLKYLIYTPTYHSLHHMDMGTNFCLFMPVYDKLWNTLNTKSWDFHKEISSRTNSKVPDFVFLVHVVDVMAAMHSPFVFRSFSSIPYSIKPFLFAMWPSTFIVMLVMWARSKTFLFSFYNLRDKLHQTWVVPRFGFQYFLPFAAEGINNQIEDAILKADKLGVKVISLAALNKNEGLNGGGVLFTNKHPNLRVRVVHGNTLTAAVIINDIPREVDEVFLTGATSKLGRAIALYLAQRKVKVLMLTLSTERFVKIQKEAPLDCQKYLVQVTKYEAAKHCKYTLERGVVHACHAGGVVHFLEGWKHHEVGAINVDQIDVVWKAALRHGLKPL